MKRKWEELKHKISSILGDLAEFRVDFLDSKGFKDFVEYRWEEALQNYPEICITGYFGEVIREKIQQLTNRSHVRLISQKLRPKSSRDEKSLGVLKKLADAGVKIKFNNRIHTRLLVAYNPTVDSQGITIIGSFDCNKDCISMERYDSGIKTRHPDIVKSTVKLFEQVWNDPDSISL